MQDYFDAVHASQPDELAACFAEDAEVHFPMQEPVVGRGKIREFYAGVFVFFRSNKIQKLRIFYDSAKVLQMLGALPSASR